MLRASHHGELSQASLTEWTGSVCLFFWRLRFQSVSQSSQGFTSDSINQLTSSNIVLWVGFSYVWNEGVLPNINRSTVVIVTQLIKACRQDIFSITFVTISHQSSLFIRQPFQHELYFLHRSLLHKDKEEAAGAKQHLFFFVDVVRLQ